MFSVIIPTHNRPLFLQEAVESVLKQSYRDFEILVINDGVDSVQFSDERITVLDNKQQGAVAARNLGIKNSKGSKIAFLDDDDVWIDFDHLKRASEIDGGFYFADGFMKYENGTRKSFARTATVGTLAKDNTILISAVCYEKHLHDRLGMFDEALPYYWDWDWYLRVARSGIALHHSEIPSVDIRVHAQNMSTIDNSLVRQANLNLLCLKHDLEDIVLKNHNDFAVLI